MTTIMIAPSNVANVPGSGGHFWVYMQYVLGLRELGCDVFWMERVAGNPSPHQRGLQPFMDRMRRFGLAGKVILYGRGAGFPPAQAHDGLTLAGRDAESACARADLLLNFTYDIDPDLLARFRKSVLVDIDPGLLQFWMSCGQLDVAEHDFYATTGETVGAPQAAFSDCGIRWHRIRPVVSLRHWPVVFRPQARVLTTVSGWWGDEWICDGSDVYENNKRVSFMQFAELARRTPQPLELALCLGEEAMGASAAANPPAAPASPEYPGDAVDRQVLEACGWIVRHANEVSSEPEDYRRYIQQSRGEFSCAKPSCMKFQNAWVSDRSLCYLASGKPIIVQHTGPSNFLPEADGMFRFRTIEDAVAAIEEMNTHYERHCLSARALAEEFFDAERVLSSLLDTTL